MNMWLYVLLGLVMIIGLAMELATYADRSSSRGGFFRSFGRLVCLSAVFFAGGMVVYNVMFV